MVGYDKIIIVAEILSLIIFLVTMPEEFQRIVPAPPPAADMFATYQLAYEFSQEVEHRQEFEDYCQWYYLTAQRHREELEKMRGDINLFGWFSRRKS